MRGGAGSGACCGGVRGVTFASQLLHATGTEGTTVYGMGLSVPGSGCGAFAPAPGKPMRGPTGFPDPASAG